MATEVHGTALKNILDGCGIFQRKVTEALANKGISSIDVNTWYSLDAMISTLLEFGPSVLLQIGKAVPNNSLFPPEIDSFEKAVMGLDFAYQMNHRNGAIGNYVVHASGNDLIVECKVPYPTPFNLGLLRGLATKFNSTAKIEELNGESGGTFKVRL